MTNASIWIHPTDFQAEGAESVLRALKEMGLRECSLATTYHAGRFLLPHATNGAVKELEDGVAYYQPDAKRWSGARLAPKLAEACAGKDLCREVRDAAAKAGVAVNAWIVALHNSRLGAAHRELTIENCFGERYPWGLCPSQPDVRRYAVELACDVAARLEPASLELEAFGFMGYTHQSHHDKAGVVLDGVHDFLLSFCCCSACSKRAAARRVDVANIAEKARKLVKEFLERGGPEPGGARLDRPEEIGPWLTKRLGAAEFAAFLSVRRETVVSLVQELRERVPAKVKLHAMAHPSPFVTGAAIGGGLVALAEVVDATILNLFHADGASAARVASLVKTARTAATPAMEFFVNLRAFAPDSESEASFVEKVAAAAREGVSGLRVYHYGLMPRANFAWVKRAATS
jgi:hypothetical protein